MRCEFVDNRDANTLKYFIIAYVNKGNHIVTNGWMGYNFLEEENSGYTRHKHLHDGGDFGIGIESTSHIESKWVK